MPSKVTDQLTLPPFEGRKPDLLKLNLTGGVEFEAAIAEAHRLDETVYIVVCADISKVAHGTDKDGVLSRVETASVETLAIFEDTGRAAELISTLNKAARARKGIEELPGMDGA